MEINAIGKEATYWETLIKKQNEENKKLTEENKALFNDLGKKYIQVKSDEAFHNVVKAYNFNAQLEDRRYSSGVAFDASA